MSYTVTKKLISYNVGGALNPVGLVIHATDNIGATAIGHFNYWNGGNRGASAHYVVDWNDTNYIVQMIEENRQAWHCMPYGNSHFIGFEMCEVNTGDKDKFQKVWDRSVWLASDILKRHGWGIEQMHSHKWVSDTYHESDHQDPFEYFGRMGVTWQSFVDAVSNALNGTGTQVPPQVIPQAPTQVNAITGVAEIIVDSLNLRAGATMDAPVIKTLPKGSKWKVSAESNGWYLVGSNAWISANEKYVHFVKDVIKTITPLPNGVFRKGHVGDDVRLLQVALTKAGYPCGTADGIFGVATYSALTSFQKAHGLTVDGVYGNQTKSALNNALN
jgi:hypothetical protein